MRPTPCVGSDVQGSFLHRPCSEQHNVAAEDGHARTRGHSKEGRAPPGDSSRQEQGSLPETPASPWPRRHRGTCAGQVGSEAGALLQVWFARDLSRSAQSSEGPGSAQLRPAQAEMRPRPESSLDPQVSTADPELRVNRTAPRGAGRASSLPATERDASGDAPQLVSRFLGLTEAAGVQGALPGASARGDVSLGLPPLGGHPERKGQPAHREHVSISDRVPNIFPKGLSRFTLLGSLP